MTSTREQVLSEFVDAWTAGARPNVDDYIARVPADEQDALGGELATFLALAPTPEYSDDALTAIRAEIAEAVGSTHPALFGALLARLRGRLGLSTREVASELVDALGLTEQQAPKTASYLERLERGALEPARVSQRVFDALGRLFGVHGSELEGAADRSGWTISPAPVFRADDDASADAARHIEVLADALAAPGGAARDEVDDLFLGGR